MNKGIILEAEFFLSSFFWGILLLFLYDCIRIFRGIKHHTWIAIASEDMLFWGVAGILVFHMVYERNFGIIRAYAAFALLSGMWLYHIIISGFFVSVMIKLVKKTQELIVKLIYRLTTPFRFVYDKMQKHLDVASRFMQKHLNKLARYISGKISIRLNKHKAAKEQKRQEKKKEKEIKKNIKQQNKQNKKKALSNQSPSDKELKGESELKTNGTAVPQHEKKYGVLERIEIQ